MSSDFLNGFWIYLFLINVVLFLLMGVDKMHAIQNRRRIPESVLLLLAALPTKRLLAAHRIKCPLVVQPAAQVTSDLVRNALR